MLASLAAASVLGARSVLAAPAAAKHRLGVFFAGWSDLALGVKEREQAKKEREKILKALAELGYVEGRNLTVDWRFFDMDFSKAPQMAAELVRLKVDVLLTAGTPQTKALRAATTTIPIVTSVNDPVASGLTQSLARPGGNITGLTNQHPATPAKQVELFRMLVPRLDRLVIVGDVRYTGDRELVRPAENAARMAGMIADVRMVDPSDVERVFSEMKGFAARAALLGYVDMDMAGVARLAIRHGVATMHFASEYVEHGGLLSFSPYHANEMQRTVSIIDKIFRGMDPAQIPWELPDRTHLAINLGTAKLLGLKVPADLLLRADQVVGSPSS